MVVTLPLCTFTHPRKYVFLIDMGAMYRTMSARCFLDDLSVDFSKPIPILDKVNRHTIFFLAVAVV